MEKLIKNVEHATPFEIADVLDYEAGQVSSLTLAQQPGVGMTLLAFDAGEGVSSHSAPGDALIVVLDGTANITIADKEYEVSKGQSIVLPAGVAHAVKAVTKYKMLLTVVKG